MNARQKAKHYKWLYERTKAGLPTVRVITIPGAIPIIHYKTRKNVLVHMLPNGNEIPDRLMGIIQNEIAREMFDVVKEHIAYDLVYEGSVPYVTGEIFIGERR